MKMPKEIGKKFCQVVAELRDIINGDHRTIQVQFKIEQDCGLLADITHTPNRRWSVMRLYEPFFTVENKECLSTVYHELLHTYWHELDEELNHILEDVLSPTHKRIFDRVIQKREEYMVDDLSVAFEIMTPENKRSRYYAIFDEMKEWYNNQLSGDDQEDDDVDVVALSDLVPDETVDNLELISDNKDDGESEAKAEQKPVKTNGKKKKENYA